MIYSLLKPIKELQSQNKFHIALYKLNEIEKQYELNSFSLEEKTQFYLLQAQCYYQDLKRPTKERFSKALDILDSIKDSNTQEILRLKGAVYKRKYQHSKDLRDLYKAISCYENAAKDTMEDMGYGAANAVYLYYTLIKELKDKDMEDSVSHYLSKSSCIAKKALEALEIKSKYCYLQSWHYASKSALHLSLEQFYEAKQALRMYKDKSGTSIDRGQAITIKQTIELFDILPKKPDDTELENILSMYDNAKSLISSVRNGKIGLALSGGGFRASLFHIGTLMRLAELDILRNVQVISTVSGGSIIGMYYYLEVKKLLESKNNQDITKQDYIDLVNRIKDNFTNAIRDNNIRMQAFIKPINQNLTEKLGELYQEKLYNLIYDGEAPTLMSELTIFPILNGTKKTEFIPEFDNFELTNKIPRIIVNATLLNNGHNWQFAAEGMGENSYMYDRTVDKNTSYPFLSYDDICTKVTISQAIASSSAVPMLFDPISFEIVKEDDDCTSTTKEGILQICDGGVYDNLGLASLVNDECTHIIISDGSKQMLSENNPSIFRLDVLTRTQDILMTKNRDAEYKIAKNLQERGIIKGLAISHLKEDIKDNDQLATLFDKVASIRTDLDSFNEIEAEATIYAGYKITAMQFVNKEVKVNFAIEGSISLSNKFESYYNNNQLKTLQLINKSSKTLFKAFEHVPLIILLLCFGSILIILLASIYYIPRVLFVIMSLVIVLFIANKKYFKWINNKIFEYFMKYISKYYLVNINKKYLDDGIIK